MRLPKYVYPDPRFRLNAGISDMRHIFVVGAPRSGTTMLANVIANHPAICSLDSETSLFAWKDTFLLFEGKAGMNSWRFNAFRREHKDLVAMFDALAQQRLAETGATRFLEKTPQHVLNLDYILKHFPKAQVVNIIRDPRDAWCSSKSNSSIAQKTPRKFARYWRRCIRTRQEFANHPAIFDIRYEDFTAAPEATLRPLMEWLGEGFDERQLSVEEMGAHHLAGSSRFRQLGKAINTGSVGRWQKDLSAEEVATINRIVEPYL